MVVGSSPTADNNLLLNIEIDLEFLILRSNLNQSLRVEGKKVLETICLAAESGYTVVSCSGVCFTFWNKVY